MESSSQNWLGFSLSNQPSPNPSSNLCLFEAFNTNHGGIERVENANCSTSELSMLCAGPKLEDFLGCGDNGSLFGRFSGGSTETQSEQGVYDSELRTIAASFLSGLHGESERTVLPSESVSKKSVDTSGHRTSIYRGVTRHRWTGRYEAHLWDNSCRREGQSRKGRQVYLGGYDKEEKAARAYDLAALKYWGPTTTTNFPVSGYEKEIEEMKNMTRQEFVASLRRKSSGFSRGASIYRGVTRHHQHGRWQARIGRVAGNKDLYLGTFSTEEEAAEAYDIAAIKFRGPNAVTNFDISRYDVKSIANSNLPIGGATSKNKASESSSSSSDSKSTESSQIESPFTMQYQPSINFMEPIKQDPQDYYTLLAMEDASQTNAKSSTTFFQSSSNVSDFSLDFSTATAINQCNGLYLNGGSFPQHNPSSVAFATPNTAASSYDTSTYGSWANGPNSLPFQPAKPNLGVFQNPIFGME